MASYGFSYTLSFVNTGLVLVGSGLSRGAWGLGGPGALSPLVPKIEVVSGDLFSTTGDGAAGFLRFYPTPEYKAPVPPSIPDSETIYIEWDVPESGTPSVKVTAPPLYKVSATIASGALAVTAEGAYGPGTCLPGYVWREAFPGDKVCVLSATRTLAAADNAAAASRINPDGPYGPKSCIAGYVWCEARPGDEVCVLPATRAQAAADDAAAESREL